LKAYLNSIRDVHKNSTTTAPWQLPNPSPLPRSFFTTKAVARQSHNKPSCDKENPQRRPRETVPQIYGLFTRTQKPWKDQKKHSLLLSFSCILQKCGTPEILVSKISPKQSPDNNFHPTLTLSTRLLQTKLRIQ
jgi:hypothetical protein